MHDHACMCLWLVNHGKPDHMENAPNQEAMFRSSPWAYPRLHHATPTYRWIIDPNWTPGNFNLAGANGFSDESVGITGGEDREPGGPSEHRPQSGCGSKTGGPIGWANEKNGPERNRLTWFGSFWLHGFDYDYKGICHVMWAFMVVLRTIVKTA